MHVTIDYLRQWQESGKKIAVYCAGTHGKHFSRILRLVGVRTSLYLDSDSGKWNTEIDGVPCCNPDGLSGSKDLLVFVCIASEQYLSVLNSVKERFQTADFTDVIDDIILHYRDVYLKMIELYASLDAADIFYHLPLNTAPAVGPSDFCGDRIAVYTGIFGGYDEVHIPRVHPSNIDYFFVSDHDPGDIGPFHWMDAKRVIPEILSSPIKRNRYIKMHPHLLFPDYKYSIYLDGNIGVTGDITEFVHHNKSGISVFMHPKRDCIFYEAITIVNFRRVVPSDVCQQMERYLEEGMPLHYGMPEMPVIAMEHAKPECRKILEDWWREFDCGAQRDQLSFMYAVWKNGMTLLDLTALGANVKTCSLLYQKEHGGESRKIANST